jgi:hypothetical protein
MMQFMWGLRQAQLIVESKKENMHREICILEPTEN